jgi:hypothetical protein
MVRRIVDLSNAALERRTASILKCAWMEDQLAAEVLSARVFGH